MGSVPPLSLLIPSRSIIRIMSQQNWLTSTAEVTSEVELYEKFVCLSGVNSI